MVIVVLTLLLVAMRIRNVWMLLETAKLLGLAMHFLVSNPIAMLEHGMIRMRMQVLVMLQAAVIHTWIMALAALLNAVAMNRARISNRQNLLVGVAAITVLYLRMALLPVLSFVMMDNCTTAIVKQVLTVV